MRLKDKLPSVAFALAEAILFFAIQLTGGTLCTSLCYASVLLALIHAMYVFFKKARGILIVVALIFTALADYCLVVMEESPRVLAMVFFSVAQIVYAVKITHGVRRYRLHIVLRIAAVLILEGLMLAVLGTSADALSVITMFYFANLTLNLAVCVARKYSILALGMLAFLLCDVFVGLGVLASDYLSVAENTFLYAITHTGINLVWLFYVPSQTLISLSELFSEERKEIKYV